MPFLELVNPFFHVRQLLLNLLKAVGFGGCAVQTGVGQQLVTDESDPGYRDGENHDAHDSRGLFRGGLISRRYEYLPVEINACHA
jgi:hypothetical protein